MYVDITFNMLHITKVHGNYSDQQLVDFLIVSCLLGLLNYLAIPKYMLTKQDIWCIFVVLEVFGLVSCPCGLDPSLQEFLK